MYGHYPIEFEEGTKAANVFVFDTEDIHVMQVLRVVGLGDARDRIAQAYNRHSLHVMVSLPDGWNYETVNKHAQQRRALLTK